MNILFFLTPKAACSFVEADDTIRQALERMECAGYASLPIIEKDGTFCGTLTEGDLLRAVRNICHMDMKAAESHRIAEIDHRKDYTSVSVDTPVEALFSKAVDQNFVPVVDDKDSFIGIVTRKAILQYCINTYFSQKEVVTAE